MTATIRRPIQIQNELGRTARERGITVSLKEMQNLYLETDGSMIWDGVIYDIIHLKRCPGVYCLKLKVRV